MSNAHPIKLELEMDTRGLVELSVGIGQAIAVMLQAQRDASDENSALSNSLDVLRHLLTEIHAQLFEERQPNGRNVRLSFCEGKYFFF